MYRMLFLAMSLIVMGAIPSLTLAETPSSETVIVVPMIDGKKEFLSTDAQGFVPTAAGPVPVRAHVTLDPWRAAAGITFKY
jgi:hypothetical protein